MSQRCVFFDGEGVIWHRGNPIPNANEVIDKIKELGYRPVVVTNNASKSVEQYYTRFQKSGYTGFAMEDVITSAACVINRLREMKFDKGGRKVFVIGTKGVIEEIRNSGFTVISEDDVPSDVDPGEMELDPRVCAVVVGSSEDFNFRHLTLASRFVIENDAVLISANPDHSYPYSPTVLVPGAYSLASCISIASGHQPIVLGKPDPSMLRAVPNYDQVDIKNSWMIGDRINTDIKFAKNTGLKSILVLTGVSKREDCDPLDDAERPDFICKDLEECYQVIKENSK